jgi:lysylphosphatidylglycerol synthetase-like protein (DUF2156 family)
MGAVPESGTGLVKVIAIILGGVLLIVAARGTEVDSANASGDKQGFWPLVYAETQQKQLWAWVVAVVLIGMFGFIKPIQPIADGILALMVIALLIGKRTFFADLQKLTNTPAA